MAGAPGDVPREGRENLQDVSFKKETTLPEGQQRYLQWQIVDEAGNIISWDDLPDIEEMDVFDALLALGVSEAEAVRLLE